MNDLKIVKNENNGLLNVAEAAELLGVKESSIRQLVFKRRIPFVKIGARVRFKRNRLESYINDNVVEIGDFD
ncbi:MAG: helix-turn-helix domain-containing protein [Candidatus Anammoxibacter sp.]